MRYANRNCESIILTAKDTIEEAMKRMQGAPHSNPPAPGGIILVVDQKEKLVGVVTDGDIRRAILKGSNTSSLVSRIMTKDPMRIKSASAHDMLVELNSEIKKRNVPENKYHSIIVVDDSNRVVDVVTPFELWRRSEVKTKTAAVIGLGYVGLTLALTLNEFGIRVFGADSDDRIVKKLNSGIPHFYEKGLDSLLKKHINKNLFVKRNLAKNESDIYIICVGTPIDQKKRVVSSYLKKACQDVGRVLKVHDLVVLRSTVPVGTCRNFVIPILEKKSRLVAGRDFFAAFAPERTVEGRALEELRTLPQIIGGFNKESLDYTSQLFQLFTRNIIFVSTLEAAEAVKLLNNTFRDVIFSFSNEVAQIFDGFNVNTREIIRAANEGYPRDKIPYPSPGVGGACLVKDPYIFAESARKAKYKSEISVLARKINTRMIDFVCDKVDDFCSANKIERKGAKIFIMGMAFKGEPETSDIRDSTSVDILKRLQKKYQNIFIYDPVVSKRELGALKTNVIFSPASGFKKADCVLVLNNHLSYRDLNIYTLSKSMNKPGFVFDGWGIYSKEELAPLSHITYYGL